eukprot:1757798-Pleurochrysis_carterae.AAC.2
MVAIASTAPCRRASVHAAAGQGAPRGCARGANRGGWGKGLEEGRGRRQAFTVMDGRGSEAGESFEEVGERSWKCEGFVCLMPCVFDEVIVGWTVEVYSSKAGGLITPAAM